MQRFLLLRYFNALRSKVEGTVKVRKLEEVRNLNSNRILFCNPGHVYLGQQREARRYGEDFDGGALADAANEPLGVHLRGRPLAGSVSP